jgi:hypothetical protein
VTGLSVGLLAVVVVNGTELGLSQTLWPVFAATQSGLALRRLLPWRLMAFLADAHERGVLHQAGAVYQFRHIELQRRLARR